jgi:S-methylmethionine-dependent homocysteine/selenocysteine methylase
MNATARKVQARLHEGSPLLLDAALGTELERRGVPASLPLWSTHALLCAPDLVRTIHREHAEAGAEILTANTFRTQTRTLARAGLGAQAARLTALAVSLARDALRDAHGAPRLGAVAGSAPPLEDCYRPDLVPTADALAREHAAHARNLAAAGVDLILCETHNCVREARAAVRAARETGLPVLASFVCGSGARLLSGEPLEAAVETIVPYGPAALLVNCLPVSDVGVCLPVLAASGLPFGVYANLGPPAEAGETREAIDTLPEAFAEAAAGWIRAGARIVGGCCGTRPEHLRALAAWLGALG